MAKNAQFHRSAVRCHLNNPSWSWKSWSSYWHSCRWLIKHGYKVAK